MSLSLGDVGGQPLFGSQQEEQPSLVIEEAVTPPSCIVDEFVSDGGGQ